MKKTVLLITEYTSVPFFYEEALKMNLSPIFLYSYKTEHMHKDIPHEFVDFSQDEKLLYLEFKAKFENIVGIVSCVEQYTTKIAKVMELLGITLNPIESYTILRDKKIMKELWIEKNISTAKMIFGKNIESIDLRDVNYPSIIKPCFGAASAGVKIIYNEKELITQMKNILRFNNTTLKDEKATKSGFLIEEYIEGDEYSIDTLWANGVPIIDGIMFKGNPEGPNFPDRLYCTETKIDEKILEMVHRSVRCVGVLNGATHTEFRIRKNIPYIIEAALRPGAGGSFFQLFEKVFNISFYKLLIQISIPLNFSKLTKYDFYNEKIKNDKIYFWYNIPYDGFGKIKEIKIFERIKELDFIKYIEIKKTVGEYIAPEVNSYSYLAWLFGEFSYNEKNEKIKILFELENPISLIYE